MNLNNEQNIYDSEKTKYNLNTLMLSEIKKNLNSVDSKYKYPLISKTFNHEEIFEITNFIISGKQLTMGNNVENFEKKFAECVGSNYAVMVNSGSSANLLAIATITNYMFENNLKKGDEVIIPALCWSTSVYPLIQCGLNPVFVDIIDNTT